MVGMDIGYNLVEQKDIQEGKVNSFDDRMSIIRFLKILSEQEKPPRDVTVLGLDALLYYAEDPTEVASEIRNVFIDAVNTLIPVNPIVQFVVEGELQQWDHLEVKYLSKRFSLFNIFGGSLTRKGINQYHAEINVLS